MNAAIKNRLIPIYQRVKTGLSRTQYRLDGGRPNAVILLAPDYGNVGDLAIRWAQEQYLRRRLPNFAVHTIPLSRTYEVLRSIRRQLDRDDIVFLVGGGSMGNLYPRAQRGREFIAGYFKHYRIISFPQSLIYSDDTAMRISGAREARALSGNRNLTLCAREAQSYDAMCRQFSNKVLIAPDIVFSLVHQVRKLPRLRREGALVVLRQDAERKRDMRDDVMIENILQDTFTTVKICDNTVPDSQVIEGNIHEPVRRMLEMHRSAEFVITDRLHGMIFAAITGTPCVAISNTNHKISATFNAWLRDACPYVEHLSQLDEGPLRAAISRVTAPETVSLSSSVDFHFDQLDAELTMICSEDEPLRGP